MRHSLVNASLLRIGSRYTHRRVPGSMVVDAGDADEVGGSLFS